MTTYTVNSGQSLAGIILNSGDQEYVYGLALNTFMSGGFQYIYSGGQAWNTHATGGTIYVDVGGLALKAALSGTGNMQVYGNASHTYVSGSGASLEVASGGAADFTEVGSSAVVDDVGAVVNTLIDPTGTLTVEPAGFSSYAEIQLGGHMNLYGVANYTTVDTQASFSLAYDLHVYSGGLAKNTTVKQGGRMLVDAGGTGVGATLGSALYNQYAGNGLVTNHGTTIGDIINQYGEEDATGTGWTMNATVNYGGRLNVYGGGTSSGTLVLYGGTEWLGNPNTSTQDTGTSHNSHVYSGGLQFVGWGAHAIGTTVYTGGLMQGRLGEISNLTIDGGTVQQRAYTSPFHTEATIDGVTTFRDTGGTLWLSDLSRVAASSYISGFAPGDTIDLRNVYYNYIVNFEFGEQPPQTLRIWYGDGGGNTLIANLRFDPLQSFTGEAFILSSDGDNAFGPGTNVTLLGNINNTSLEITADHTADGLIINNGSTLTIEPGGRAIGTTINSGGSVLDEGTADSTIVNTGGYILVPEGGSLHFAYINGGTVEIGPIADPSLIGRIVFQAGGGELILNDSHDYQSAISGFASPAMMDLKDISFGPGTTRNFVEAADNSHGYLTVTDGTASGTAHLLMIGSYTTSQFQLSDDGTASHATLVSMT